MTASPTRRTNDGLRRSPDRPRQRDVRRLLLDDPLEPVPEAPVAPAPESTSTSAIGLLPFATAFLVALVLAGLSWGLAGSLSEPDSPASSAPGLAETPAIAPERATELVIRLAAAPDPVESGALRLEETARALDAQLEQAADGRILSLRISAERVPELAGLLETGGFATLAVAAADVPNPTGTRSEDWKEWSDRLQLRRAVRRVERLGGTVRLGVEIAG